MMQEYHGVKEGYLHEYIFKQMYLYFFGIHNYNYTFC